jgi:acetylornithine deacetylase/succinyl-diaminopimelate desuccinylase-like protein
MASSDPPREYGPTDGEYERPVELLRDLIRFDTTNPPGNERACVEWVEKLLSEAGFSTKTYARDPDRPNLVARLSGGDSAPLMLYGHVDVVPTTGQDWTHPPFEGVVADDCVWGRGALDMKGGVAMMLAAALRVAEADADPAGDLVVTILSDEEGGGDAGAAYMVEAHPEVFADVEYALGEFGGFTMELAGERFFPIQVNEKVVCWLELTFRGDAGHGSMPHTDTAMEGMARAVAAIEDTRLPVHVTPTVEELVDRVAAELDPETAATVRALTDPERTDAVLDELGEEAKRFDSLLHNVANPTVVRGGDKENVVPAKVTVTVDCRLVPGQTDTDVIAELREVVPEDVEVAFEVVEYQPFPAETDRGLFELLGGVLNDADPGATAVPFLLSGATDGRHLARVGVQSYGFTPMNLSGKFDFVSSVHAADERIPIDALTWGVDRMYEAVRRYES